MQTANILLAIGNDQGNTVPKYGVTASEIAVLCAIHGDGAVTDIEPVGDVERSAKAELARIKSLYGGAKDAENQSIVEMLFPGAAAPVFDKIKDLDLPKELFKPSGRVTDPLDHDGDGRKGGTKKPTPAPRKGKKAAEKPAEEADADGGTEAVEEPAEDEDEVQDMGDGNTGSGANLFT